MPGSHSRYASILGRAVALPLHTRGGSRMRESRSYGSVRGARGETRVPTATSCYFRIWHEPADPECPLSRRVLEGKRTCHGDRESDVHDPKRTLIGRRPTATVRRRTRWPFKMTVARLPLGSEVFWHGCIWRRL